MTNKEERRSFTKEYKLDVIQQSYRCDNIKALALQLDLRPELVYRWRSQYKEEPDISFPGQGNPKQTPKQEQIAQLRKELKDAQTEPDILQKAIGIFTKKNR